MGPRAGVRVVESAGIGPGPFAPMLLAALGADVVRVDRAGQVYGGDPNTPPKDVMNRGRRSIGVDLKNPEGVETVLQLVEHADALIEGFRPGVTDRLGIGPDACLARNPRLVYGRMTGWGQDGPMAQMAGHDINYISIGGALGAIGRPDERPQPPLNLVGDFGGGGMLLAFGIACALIEARTSGKGQVVDAAMVDGTAVLTTFMHGFMAMGIWSDERGVNMLDTGAPYYEVYTCADGKFLSVGAIEPQFYMVLLERTGLLGDPDFEHQNDRSKWARQKERLTEVIGSRTRDEWAAIFDGTDGCVAPVLSLGEAPLHPHNVARNAFVENAGVVQPAPAPRFSRTVAEVQRPPAHPGQHTDEVLKEWNVADDARLAALRADGAIA